LISTASLGPFGAASRQPAVPRIPEGQPANVRVEAETSPFHGGPGGAEAGSVVNLIKVDEICMVPLEPVASVPNRSAEAAAGSKIIARITKLNFSVGAGFISLSFWVGTFLVTSVCFA
jgi:hypothetical protein